MNHTGAKDWPPLRYVGAGYWDPMLASVNYRPLPPARVANNRWPDIEVPAIGAWEADRRVSVVIPYYQAPEALNLTLVALARQTYPRGLMQVVVVDDGSEPPLSIPPEFGDLVSSTIHQEDRGFGLARARNTGAAAADGDILVFLDCDMVPEPAWLEAHARWHHCVADALTLGFRRHVDFEGVTAAEIDRAAAGGNVGGVFADRHQEKPEWIEHHIARLDDLTSGADDLFRIVTGGNLGIRRDTFAATGGFDESFTQWGAEDTEFGFRCFTWGAVIIPERRALCWHQGLGTLPDDAERRSLEDQRIRISHLIAEKTFRRSLPGRSFQVPMVLVRVSARPGDAAEEVAAVVEGVLGNRFHDLVVVVSVPADHPARTRLVYQFAGDPRVFVGAPEDVRALFPHTPVRIDMTPDVRLIDRSMGRILEQLGGVGVLEVSVPGGGSVRAVKTRALSRAERLGVEDPIRVAGDLFGRAEGDWRDVGIRSPMSRKSAIAPIAALQRWRVKVVGPDSHAGKILRRFGRVRSPQDAAATFRWLFRAIASRVRPARDRGRRSVTAPVSRQPLEKPSRQDPGGIPRVATVGAEAGRIFGGIAGSFDVKRAPPRMDLLVVDPTGLDEPVLKAIVERAKEAGSAVVGTKRFEGSDGTATGPAAASSFDPCRWNPRGFIPARKNRLLSSTGPVSGVQRTGLPFPVEMPGGLTSESEGGLEQLVREARPYLAVADLGTDRRSAAKRTSTLIRLAAAGVPVFVDTLSEEERMLLGADLSEAMSAVDPGSLIDPVERERLSVQLRRAAHTRHSFDARRRQLLDQAGVDASWPKVTVVLATYRPELIGHALAQIQRQTYPRLELVVAFHGVPPPASHLDFDGEIRVVTVPGTVPFGEALNRALAVASGSLISKMDDDDWYSPDHLWDLVMAHGYSRAALVGKGAEFVYLAGSDRTIRRFVGGAESGSTTLGGGALLIGRTDLDAIGGWRRIERSVDRALIDDVLASGGAVYRTHGFGYLLHRRQEGHTWNRDDAYFLDQAESWWRGLDLRVAGIQ